MLLPDIPYCENFSASFPLEQPLNAASNAAFLVAAVLLWREFRPTGLRSRLLVLSVGLIGLTSLIWHLSLHPPLLALDFTGILLFQTLVWFWVLAPLLALQPRQAVGGFVALFLMMLGAHLLWPERWTPGSGVFVPILLMLLVLAGQLHAHRNGLFLSFAALGAAFAARLADVPTCAQTYGIGTHWLWHGLTAVAVYVLVRTILRPLS
jgi:hypothetical protein